MHLSVSMGLTLVGTDEEPRWAGVIGRGPENRPNRVHCCDEGHYTPEAAAAHGSERAAAWLSQAARRLPAGTCGALALEKIAA